MSNAFFKAGIRQSIANETLQIALDGNARRRVQGRITAFASLPDWRERRQRAHALRAQVVSHLEEYLDQFIDKVTENGIVVHRAGDAAEAIRLVLEIIEHRPPRTQSNPQDPREILPDLRAGQVLVAKSKSMVSEEIGLNHALEANGIRVVETDLGEYIVQLRHEKPAHIITPAVHLRRQEVGRLFQEKLGIPYTEDIPTLTATARKVLRQVFLTADAGLSGVNFGVAETGSLCIVTNEGNGRMVTSVPPVHIALMGMERLLPGLDDLALMLSLLPRSATAQKLSVYTQLIHAPRRAGERDGARERHLVIVDNGRARLVNSPLEEALYCIRCGSCLNACPVFRELGGHAYVGSDGSIAPYSGPIGAVVSPGLLGLDSYGHLAQASSLCGACKDACPVDIDLPKLLTRVRAGYAYRLPVHPSGPQGANELTSRDRARGEGEKGRGAGGVGLSLVSRLGLRAYGVVASSSRMFNIAQRLAAWGARLLSPFSDWLRAPSFTGWGYSKDFPRPALRPFHARWKEIHLKDTEATEKGFEKGEKHVPPAETHREEEDKIERFKEELTALGGNVYRVSRDEVSKQMVDLLQGKEIEDVMMWDQVTGLDEAGLIRAGLKVSHDPDPALRAGLTGAACAIAETGTLVIPSAPGQPLGASLLAEIHVAVIRSSQIVQTLEEAMRSEAMRSSSSVALVTGPSRTADIEMALTIGVHGPREVHVFVVDG